MQALAVAHAAAREEDDGVVVASGDVFDIQLEGAVRHRAYVQEEADDRLKAAVLAGQLATATREAPDGVLSDDLPHGGRVLARKGLEKGANESCVGMFRHE